MFIGSLCRTAFCQLEQSASHTHPRLVPSLRYEIKLISYLREGTSLILIPVIMPNVSSITKRLQTITSVYRYFPHSVMSGKQRFQVCYNCIRSCHQLFNSFSACKYCIYTFHSIIVDVDTLIIAQKCCVAVCNVCTVMCFGAHLF